ncbi:hypothetical protein AZSI13_10150 [Azospira sp. I13]|uniref:Na/Pi cotransporter family protein n=1 Tax=Azospira sp. I13 TaxID=1765050 RepID=UPI000D4C96E5|nr:Na/Pi symporter [Azospira sp. I13]GBG01688.1 hypothetical protein AZSI13_10150 [Azospira sp. I13]
MTAAASPLALLTALLGGIGLFLLGMTMLTDGLKLAAGRALERILAAWTRTRLHGLITGIGLTALMQSSTAMTVAAIGFVNAGLLSFAAALWVVFGSNLGSSVTGWLVAWIGFKMPIDAFALPFIGIGMALKLTGEGTRRSGLGTSLAGFGLLFLGIELLKNGFAGLGPDALPPLGSDPGGLALAILIGIVLTIVLQASSATLTLVLTAVAGGMFSITVGAAMIIGANVGTTLTGILAAIGATANAKRLAAAHVLFNVVTAVVATLLLLPLLWLVREIDEGLNGGNDLVTQLVIFHTLFNALGVLLMALLSRQLVPFLLSRFVSTDDNAAQPRYLDRNVASVPPLALQALRRELARVGRLATQLAEQACRQVERQETPDTVQYTRRLEVVERLQAEIGKFVSEISRRPMHRDVAGQLPELLRIATYYDTLARVMYHVALAGQAGPRALASAHSGELADLRESTAPVFAAARDFFIAADPETGEAPDSIALRADEARNGFEDIYQATKARLLNAGTAGADVNAMYDWLACLSDVRRAVAQGHKASQRLASLPELREPNLLSESDD